MLHQLLGNQRFYNVRVQGGNVKPFSDGEIRWTFARKPYFNLRSPQSPYAYTFQGSVFTVSFQARPSKYTGAVLAINPRGIQPFQTDVSLSGVRGTIQSEGTVSTTGLALSGTQAKTQSEGIATASDLSLSGAKVVAISKGVAFASGSVLSGVKAVSQIKGIVVVAAESLSGGKTMQASKSHLIVSAAQLSGARGTVRIESVLLQTSLALSASKGVGVTRSFLDTTGMQLLGVGGAQSTSKPFAFVAGSNFFISKGVTTTHGFLVRIGDSFSVIFGEPVEPPVVPPGGGGALRRPSRRASVSTPVERRRPARGRRVLLEASAERLISKKTLPDSYPVGAHKAYAAMQAHYGPQDGKRIFIKKALEQGNGSTVRDKVANIYAKGATGKKKQKVKTIVRVPPKAKKSAKPKIKILSAR